MAAFPRRSVGTIMYGILPTLTKRTHIGLRYNRFFSQLLVSSGLLSLPRLANPPHTEFPHIGTKCQDSGTMGRDGDEQRQNGYSCYPNHTKLGHCRQLHGFDRRVVDRWHLKHQRKNRAMVTHVASLWDRRRNIRRDLATQAGFVVAGFCNCLPFLFHGDTVF